eukprot:1161545-Pelagomonas_calceolata.AAC.13
MRKATRCLHARFAAVKWGWAQLHFHDLYSMHFSCFYVCCSEMGVGLAAFRGHMLPVWDVAAAPLGYHFASASADRTARVWATDNVCTLRIFAGCGGGGLVHAQSKGVHWKS